MNESARCTPWDAWAKSHRQTESHGLGPYTPGQLAKSVRTPSASKSSGVGMAGRHKTDGKRRPDRSDLTEPTEPRFPLFGLGEVRAAGGLKSYLVGPLFCVPTTSSSCSAPVERCKAFEVAMAEFHLDLSATFLEVLPKRWLEEPRKAPRIRAGPLQVVQALPVLGASLGHDMGTQTMVPKRLRQATKTSGKWRGTSWPQEVSQVWPMSARCMPWWFHRRRWEHPCWRPQSGLPMRLPRRKMDALGHRSAQKQ